jgi:flagellar hook-associated protein 1 FlgK
MDLSVALNTARSSLLATAQQIAVSGRNIAGANDPSYTRKLADTTTTADGAARIVTVARAADAGLLQRVLGATAANGGSQAILDGLNQLQAIVGDTTDDTSPAARLSDLATALQNEANSPSDPSLAQATLSAAKSFASTLNDATATVTGVRTQADQAMATSVAHINQLLGQFSDLNAAAVRGTHEGQDVTDILDQRDAVLSQLSGEIGITTMQRADNDVAIYTDGGVPLFDKTARTVSFTASSTLAPGVSGNAVLIDGVPVTGSNAAMPLTTGKLAGLAQLRDDIAPTFQTQLDEMARGAIESLAESDQSGGGGPDKAGLLTYAGGPAVPQSGVAVPGLAGTIAVNAGVDPAQGGNLNLIRDGGINGSSYSYNPSGAASFSDRLQGMVDALSAPRAFDSASALQSSQALTDFGSASVGWLESLRQTTSNTADYQSTLLSNASDALSNASGVNVDDEYAKQLQLEQSYQASSKLIAAINQLFDTLLASITPPVAA